MAKKQEKLMIVDGNALVHRSYHALPRTMATKDGEITNAVYGFTTVLLKAISDIKPDYVAVAFDLKAPTFRHEMFAGYKANRAKAPDELYAQMPRVKEVVRAFNIPIFEKEGFEADDLIGTIADISDDDLQKTIVTGDMDTLQLVNDRTKVYTLSRGLTDSVIYDTDSVRERFGIDPEQMIDFKALRGDPSDNIPGVKGIGEKTAGELLRKFGSLENLYDAVRRDRSSLSDIKPRIIELLKLHEDDAFLSKELATINRAVEIDFDLQKTRLSDFNKQKVADLFVSLEFRSLLPRIKDMVSADLNKPEDSSSADKFERNKKIFNYQLIASDGEFNSFLDKFNEWIGGQKDPSFAFDTETTGFDPISSELLGISFSWEEGKAFFVLIPQDERKKRAPRANAAQQSLFTSEKSAGGLAGGRLGRLNPFFASRNIRKICHNGKFDTRVVQSYGIVVDNLFFDTMVASYLTNPGTRQHNLDSLVYSELGHEKISKEDLLGKGKSKLSFEEVDSEKLSLYSCEDADFTNRLSRVLSKSLAEKKLEALFFEMEMPLVTVLADMENAGIKIDPDFLSGLSKKYGKKIRELEEEIWTLAGRSFNIKSTQQLKEMLFEKLEISTQGIGRTKTGLSTSADELEKIKDSHPIVPLVQEYRELTKLKSTYIDALPKLINPVTGRLHTSFNQAVTATGRLSSTEPNLQNIPVRTELGKEIRIAFVAEPGYVLASLDYSQIELRLAAHMSGDPTMIKAFKENLDIHKSTAAEINDVALEEVTLEMRRDAKAVNFGVLYGQGAIGLSQTAGIPFSDAKKFIDNYFSVFSRIKQYIDTSISLAIERGYAETLFGRRRLIPDINSNDARIRSAAERTAVNTPVQGTAADIIKSAMIKISPLAVKSGGDLRMLLQVHDELVFEVRQDKLGHFLPQIKKLMENVISLDVPIKVDVKTGPNWGKMREIKL
jgi:DNA polymerase-1